jgi:transcriptional regulator with XRE-family HTH domain
VATELGKFLRKLRVDHKEQLKDMAARTSMSTSGLSAMEIGKKKMPTGFCKKVCEAYQLNADQKEYLIRAIADTESSIEIDMAGMSAERKCMVAMFAEKVSEMNDRKAEEIRRILERN